MAAGLLPQEEGKLVGTFGSRKDIVNDRNAPLALMTSDLRDYDFDASNRWINGVWRRAQGKTTSMSVVVRPFQDIKFLKNRVADGSGVTRFLAEAVNGLSLTYNKSDNFIAQGPAYDLFLNQLPNQTGTDTNYGLWMTMLDGKLSIRYNHFDTRQLDLRNGDISTMAQRILRYEGFIANDAYNLRTQATAWINGLGTGGSAATGVTGEPVGNGYARQRVTFTGTGVQSNAEALRFVFTSSVGTLTHAGLFDAASGGNPLAFVALPQPAAMTGPGTVTIAAGALTLSAG